MTRRITPPDLGESPPPGHLRSGKKMRRPVATPRPGRTWSSPRNLPRRPRRPIARRPAAPILPHRHLPGTPARISVTSWGQEDRRPATTRVESRNSDGDHAIRQGRTASEAPPVSVRRDRQEEEGGDGG